MIYRVLYISGGAGFLPSTVAMGNGPSETERFIAGVLFMNQLWVGKVTMEHGPIEDVFPIENGDTPSQLH